MRQLLLFFLTLFTGHAAHAQNYQCLQSGVKRYFTNSNGYLRGMRIDSVRTIGSDIIYYPFHTARGNYIISHITPLDSNGGSWLGKKVIQHSDGSFLFDNIWNDTVIIKTQAHVGDSWIFYNDTTSKYYMATVISQDTMTVLGSFDSIKRIRINAYNGLSLDPSDSINNFQIILSKNNGFVKVCDLYTFPYHRPDTVYEMGYDFYLDCIISDNARCFNFFVSTVYSHLSFNLVQYITPTYSQLYDWSIGDVFENSIFDGSISNYGTYPYGYYFDSIIAKTITASGTQYSYYGWAAKMHLPPGTLSYYYGYPFDTASTSGVINFSYNLLIDTSIMPEENTQQLLLYYIPNDTNYCLNSDMYKLLESSAYSPYICFEGEPLIRIYKTGIGLIKYNWNILAGSPPRMHDTTLLYYKKSGTPCGHYTYPSPIYHVGVNEPNKLSFSIFPNPAREELTIQTHTAQSYTITLQNMLGQTIIILQAANQTETINLGNIPAGIYSVSITDEQGNRHNQKVLIGH